MRNIEYYDVEDRPLLVLPLDSEKCRISQPVYEAAITRGAVNYLGRWPTHVFTAFIAGCLVFATFIIFGIITAILTIPLGEKCRIPRDTIEANYQPNVYFVKHENRTWSSQEFCYIETTARRYKNLSIYLINLIDENDNFQSRGNFSRGMIKLLEPKHEVGGYAELPISVEIFDHDHKSAIKRQASSEKQSITRLAAFNANIKNIDVPIGSFFNGSRLTNICNRLSENMVEIAARAYVLWNFPGVALDPGLYRYLDVLKEYLSKNINDGRECRRDSVAAIELHGDIQATSVPCQAFLDHLIRQISMNEFSGQQNTLEKTIGDFCPRPSQCQGVRLLSGIPKSEFSEETIDCPTIIPVNGKNRNYEGIRDVSKTL